MYSDQSYHWGLRLLKKCKYIVAISYGIIVLVMFFLFQLSSDFPNNSDVDGITNILHREDVHSINPSLPIVQGQSIHHMDWVNNIFLNKNLHDLATKKKGDRNVDGRILELTNGIVAKQQESITNEMKNYPFPDNRGLDDLVIERGGRPMVTLILSSWRSGSSFFGKLLSSHPGIFYYFEPLYHYGMFQLKDSQSEEAAQNLTHIFKCNFTGMEEFLRMEKGNGRTGGIWSECSERKDECSQDPHYVEEMCKLYPIHLAKVVKMRRMRLRHARPLLEDPTLNIKFVHLVRDPRSTIESRERCAFCVLINNSHCWENVLCPNLESDYLEAQKLRVEYPTRFMTIRHEDLSMDTLNVVSRVVKFMGLEMHDRIKEFIRTHTNAHVPRDTFDLHAVSRKIPLLWLRMWKNKTETINRVLRV